MLLSSLLIVLGLAVYFMNPDERARVLRAVLARLGAGADGARRFAGSNEPLFETLRARTPWVFVTPVLVALNVTAFTALLLGPTAIGDPDTLVALGGNFAPRTTNGEWGRLVTAMFLHAGFFELLVNLAALISVGLVLERLVGPLTFFSVYVAAGVLAGLASLTNSLAGVTVGASGAIFGLYGLLTALWAFGTIQRATTTIRLATITRLAPAGVVFVAFSALNGSIGGAAESAGVVVGFVSGLVLGRWVAAGRPPARKVALTLATAGIIILIIAVPLRGVADVRPVLAQVLDVESRMSREYDAAVERFTRGRLSAAALAAFIDESVAPELQHTGTLLHTLHKVPPEHRPLVAAAETYLRLRQESWQLRATALRKGNAALLRNAEAAERASLDALALLRRGA